VAVFVRRHAANRRLVLGAQSGSPAVLERIGRRHAPEDVERAARTILAEGLAVDVDFILGFPEETDEERAETVRFMRALSALGARLHLHAFLPLAGTPLYRRPPSAIDAKTRRAVESMTGPGLVFGEWRKQERLAAEVRAFLGIG